MDHEFISFPKIPRLSREVIITEKLDGTNAQIYIADDGNMYAGSRNRWLTPENDNFGFGHWVAEHAEELRKLGLGRHYGEWWGKGIQRGYGLTEKRFSLFNTHRYWTDAIPDCCTLVPVLYRGVFNTGTVDFILSALKGYGSQAAPGFMKPEGVMIYHVAARQYFKKTCENDEKGKEE